MKFGLSEYTLKKLSAVFSQHPEIEAVIIYGSRAKGTYQRGSDIDITLKGKNLSSTILNRIVDDLEEANTPYFFDVSIFKNLTSKELINHIERVGKVMYQKKLAAHMGND